VAVLPARPAHPRDKPKVEVGVQVVERWILARLRNRRFFSLAELNAAIAELLLDLNQRAFKKLPGCRACRRRTNTPHFRRLNIPQFDLRAQPGRGPAALGA
jgi:transposase